MLTRAVMPTEEELFKRYNPELQARAIANREAKAKETQEFLDKLKEYSLDKDRPIWVVAKEEAQKKEKEVERMKKEEKAEKERMMEEIRRERLGR